MAYLVSKVYVTKAKDSIDGKVHRRTNYYCGMDNLGGFGVTNWGERKHAYKFHYQQTAERCARSYGGKVIEIED